MKERNNVPYEPIMEAVKDKYGDSVVVDFLDFEINVRRTISYAEFCGVVNGVVESCFDRDSGVFLPENRAFATMLAVTATYTDLELPADTEEQYKLLYGGNLYETISAYIDDGQYRDLCMAIKAKIEAINNANYVLFKSETERALEAMRKLVGSVEENFNRMFAGLDDGDIRRMVQAIGENGIDEEKIARAVASEMNARREEQEKVIPFPAQETNDGE